MPKWKADGSKHDDGFFQSSKNTLIQHPNLTLNTNNSNRISCSQKRGNNKNTGTPMLVTSTFFLSSCLGFVHEKPTGTGLTSCFKVISLPRAPWCIRAHLRSLGCKPIDPKRYQLEGLWHKYESHIIRFTPMINELVVEPTHLKNIRQNWIISPIFGVKKKHKYLKPPPR